MSHGHPVDSVGRRVDLLLLVGGAGFLGEVLFEPASAVHMVRPAVASAGHAPPPQRGEGAGPWAKPQQAGQTGQGLNDQTGTGRSKEHGNHQHRLDTRALPGDGGGRVDDGAGELAVVQRVSLHHLQAYHYGGGEQRAGDQQQGDPSLGEFLGQFGEKGAHEVTVGASVGR